MIVHYWQIDVRAPGGEDASSDHPIIWVSPSQGQTLTESALGWGTLNEKLNMHSENPKGIVKTIQTRKKQD